MSDLRPSEIIYIDHASGRVTRDLAIRIIAQHGWQSDQCGICVTPCDGRSVECPASFDADLGVHSHYSIADVRDWLGY